MSRKVRHNEIVRARILAAASAGFREAGYERAGIDEVMARAGLTRGAFYAHFGSKAALFAAALGEEDLVLRLLRGRSTASPDALGLGLLHIFRALLDPEHGVAVASASTLPALARDAALGDAAAREAYDAALHSTLAEMARGIPAPPDHPALAAALALACGALAMAAACDDRATRDAILRATAATVRTLLEAAIAPPGQPAVPA